MMLKGLMMLVSESLLLPSESGMLGMNSGDPGCFGTKGDGPVCLEPRIPGHSLIIDSNSCLDPSALLLLLRLEDLPE